MRWNCLFLLFVLGVLVIGCAKEPIIEKEPVIEKKELIKEVCKDECAKGQKQCYENYYQQCGNYDTDNCLEWSSPTNCPEESYCQDGQCFRREEIKVVEEVKPEAEYKPEERKEDEITPTPIPTPTLISPGDYPRITGIQPFLGSADAPLKVVFVNVDNAPIFDDLVTDAIYNQFNQVSPFKENFNSIAFYKTRISYSDYLQDCGINLICVEERNSNLIQQKIKLVDSNGRLLNGLEVIEYSGVILVIFEGTSVGGLGEGKTSSFFISIPITKVRNASQYLPNWKNTIIHEVGHTLGLSDLYPGWLFIDSKPFINTFNSDMYKSFFNIDRFGCPKWCNSYKPVSEYTQSQCLTFTNKQDCLSFGRNEAGLFTEAYVGCSWARENESINYFNTHCVPSWGRENIGIDCLEGTGCYFGAVEAIAWRPVLDYNESIMFGPSSSKEFDPVSKKTISNIFRCCLSYQDSDSNCENFRKEYTDYLKLSNNKNKRLGSCGYSQIVS